MLRGVCHRNWARISRTIGTTAARCAAARSALAFVGPSSCAQERNGLWPSPGCVRSSKTSSLQRNSERRAAAAGGACVWRAGSRRVRRVFCRARVGVGAEHTAFALRVSEHLLASRARLALPPHAKRQRGREVLPRGAARQAALNAETRSVTVRVRLRCARAHQLSANGRGWEGLKLDGAGRGRGASSTLRLVPNTRTCGNPRRGRGRRHARRGGRRRGRGRVNGAHLCGLLDDSLQFLE